MKKINNDKGFTLIELIIAISLMSVVGLVAMRLMFASVNIGTDARIDIKEQGRYVTETIDNAIKYTNAVFTIPRDSFVDEKLTATWSYLGIKPGVTVPAAITDDGVEIINAKALVHIQSVGSNAPTSLKDNQRAIQNDDGWFLETILGYEHDVDNGDGTKYTLKYALKAYYQDGGNKVGDNLIDVSTEINSINALQVVYQGSALNPAVAFAFHEEAYKVDADITKVTKANIVFVFDTSGSMGYSVSGSSKKRMDLLKENSKTFIEEFTNINSTEVRISGVTFSRYGTNLLELSSDGAIAKQGNTTLTSKIDNMTANGGTNLGDGIRMAYHQFKKFYSTLTNEEDKNTPTFLLLVSDGDATFFSYNRSSNTSDNIIGQDWDWKWVDDGWRGHWEREWYYLYGKYYTNSNTYNSNLFTIGGPGNGDDAYGNCRKYMETTAGMFTTTTDFPKPTVYMINVVSSDGDLDDQSKALMDAFGQSDYENFVYNATSDTSFAEAISTIVNDIKVSASLLEGPKL